jgi:thioredoxin 1
MSPLRLIPLAIIAIAAPAHAAQVRKFDSTAFAAAKAQNLPILVDVKAWWCPVCASQNRKIKRITANPAYNQLVIFELNFDTQKAEWKALGVQRQGTLIGFHGQRQTGRLDFITDEGKITELLAATVR